MRLARETVIHLVGALITSAAGFFGTVVIARYLGAEALGIYSLVLALLFWLDIPTTGIQIAVMKRVSEGTERATYFATGVAASACSVLLIGLGVLFARDSVNAYVGADIAPLFILLFGVNAIFGTVISGLQAQKQVGLSGLFRALERILRTVFQVSLILLSYAVGGLVIGHVASVLLVSVLALWFYGFGLAIPRLKHLRDLLSYAKYAWGSQLKGKANGWLDTMVLGFFVSASFIGIYEVAWSLASTLILLTNSIGQTLFPEVSDLNEQDDYKKIREHINEALTFSGIVMIPGFVGATILGSDLLRVYGTEFTTGSTVLLILIFARMVNSIGSNFYTVINALDRPRLAFHIAVPVMAANLFLNVALISTIGWYGAAIATALTSIIYLILCYGILKKLIGDINLPTTEIGRQLAASLVMGSVIWILSVVAPSTSVITVGLVLVGASVYAGVLISISMRLRQKIFDVAGTF